MWVFVPSNECAIKGNEIKSAIEKKWKPPKNYYHLRKGGHIDAVKSHLHNSIFIHLDIRNFFGSINKTRVTRCIKQLLPYSTAREMANFSTVVHPEDKKSILPFGFVQSPIIASLCLYKSALGAYIRTLHKVEGLTLSIYVDDIILSSNNSAQLDDILSGLKKAASRAGFELNEKKQEGPADIITAFNIEVSNGSLAITNQRLNKFKKSFDETDSEHKRRGIFGYITSVNENQSENFIYEKKTAEN